MQFTEKTIESEYLYQGKIINLRKDKIEQQDGRQFMREIVEHHGGVGIVAITEANEVLLVTQFRKPFEELVIEIPAGKLELGENPIECAARELEEETGFIAEKLTHLITVYPSPGFLTEQLHLYAAQGLSHGAVHLDDGEHLTSQSIDFNEALKMIEDGRIKDAKTVIGLLLMKSRI